MKIIGTGTDIIEISRVEKAISGDTFLKRVYTENERLYADSKGNKAQTYAGMFAAKEACVKALGGYITDYEILHRKDGKPFVNNKNIELSVSHCNTYAVAFAIAFDI